MPNLFTNAVKWLSRSRTGPQLTDEAGAIGWATTDDELKKPKPFTYAVARQMIKNPTVALARSVFSGPIASGEWSVESDEGVDEARLDFIREEIVGRRQDIMSTILHGIMDHGWSPFEKVFGVRADGRVGLAKLKPLLHDLTTILIDAKTGAFTGFRQEKPTRDVNVSLDTSLLVPFQVEGTDWYGHGLLENAHDAFLKWTSSNAGADRYDRKVAGSHWVVHYPKKKQTLDDTATRVSNLDIAKDLLAALEANGCVAIPTALDDLTGWKIELLSDQGGGATNFVPRLEYLDRQLFRAFLMPERTAMEGRFGTKAEAATHIDVAITTMELVDRHITRHINWYVVDQLLALNFGDEARGTVRLSSAPLADIKRELIVELYKKIIDNPQGFMAEIDSIDRDAIKEQLGIPINQNEEDEEWLSVVPLPGVDPDDDELAASMGVIYSESPR